MIVRWSRFQMNAPIASYIEVFLIVTLGAGKILDCTLLLFRLSYLELIQINPTYPSMCQFCPIFTGEGVNFWGNICKMNFQGRRHQI